MLVCAIRAIENSLVGPTFHHDQLWKKLSRSVKWTAFFDIINRWYCNRYLSWWSELTIESRCNVMQVSDCKRVKASTSFRGSSALTWNRLTAPESPRMTEIRVIKRIARPRERFRTKTSQQFYVFNKIGSKLRNARQQHMHMKRPVQSPLPTLWHSFDCIDGYNDNNTDKNKGKVVIIIIIIIII